jgi:hypothetical protein
MTDTEMPVDKLVSVYLKIRTAIQEAEEAHKQQMEELKAQFDVVAGQLLEVCNEQNMDSIRTPAGTVTRRVSSRYWTSDWDSMYEFIREHDAPYLLEQRIHNGNMRQFLEENSEVCPMGLQADRKYTVQVRKPTSK